MIAIAAVLVLLAVVAGFVVVIVLLAKGRITFASPGGYRALTRRFPAPAAPAGQRYDGQGLRIGSVRRQRSATLVFAPEGLYLALLAALPGTGPMPAPYPEAMLIPWTEFRAAKPDKLFGESAVSLTIGEPQIAVITMHMQFFLLVQHYTQLQLAG